MRAVIYARFSTELQSASSLDDQVRLCRERIEQDGHELVNVYKDRAISGASLMRPGIQSLMQDASRGAVDVIYAEALDRISRDQEDVAGFFKRLRFADVKIVTLAEGEISELHVGLKGTMNALFLKDLADKTRRGLRGRVEAGRSGGGNAYGYDVVRTNSDGTVEAGERRINLAEAKVVLRIFVDVQPGRIAAGDRQDAEPRGHLGTFRGDLGPFDHQRQPRPRHRHPQQRALYRQAGLEPAALHQRPDHRKAPVAAQQPRRSGSSRRCRSCASYPRTCGRRSSGARVRWHATRGRTPTGRPSGNCSGLAICCRAL